MIPYPAAFLLSDEERPLAPWRRYEKSLRSLSFRCETKRLRVEAGNADARGVEALSAGSLHLLRSFSSRLAEALAALT
jgi:hypothetical protein